jgi:hypothetical protein
VIVLGDFNDYDGEILDINNNIPKSHVLEILKKGTSTHTYTHTSTHTHPHTHTHTRGGGVGVHGGGRALQEGETDTDPQTHTHTQSNNRELVSAGIFAQKEDLYTDWWDKNGDCVATDDEWDAIDHVRSSNTHTRIYILSLTNSPKNNNKKQIFQNSHIRSHTQVLMTPALAEKIVGVYYYHGYTEKCNTTDSDHYPIVVDFDFSHTHTRTHTHARTNGQKLSVSPRFYK